MQRLAHTQHPTQFVWDFWYEHDAAQGLFHLWYLNAPKELAARDEHHFVAQVGYAVTPDFRQIDWIDDAVLCPSADGWDNGSIWTGSVRREGGGWLMAYTGRDAGRGDGMTQAIGFAFSSDRRHWQRLEPARLEADPRWYESESVPQDGSIHAWRDPGFARLGGEELLLISAKQRGAPLGRKGAVAMARIRSPQEIEVLPPLAAPASFGEMELPELRVDREGKPWLLYSTGAKGDQHPATEGAGGLQCMPLREQDGRWRADPAGVKLLLPESSGLYAARIIDELAGDLVGFDIEQGGLVRCSAELRPLLRRPDA